MFSAFSEGGCQLDWIEVTVKTTTEGAEAAAQLFYDIGVQGVVIEDPDEVRRASEEERTWDYIDDSVLMNMSEEVLVKGYLSNDAFAGGRLHYIREKAKWLLEQDLGIDPGSLDISLTNVREEDWANNWKKYYKPIKVSPRLVIKPTWEDYTPEADERILELDPGMAFGTGTHETTVLCIKAIDRYIREGSTLLDVGCGTGVLSIAGILLGAVRADAVDIDANAVRVAAENAALNNVSDRMNVIHGNLLDEVHGRYGIVVANIIADVVIHLTEFIGNYLEKGGIFIASGIILDRLEDVVSAVKKAGLPLIHRETMGEWAVVVAEKQ
jgi:ribosomal protein L11 methyltransferase